MVGNIIFNCCAVPIYSIILISIFVKGATKGWNNKYFIFVNAISLVSTIFDIGIAYIFRYGFVSEGSLFLAVSFEYGYFFLHIMTMLFYQLYLIFVLKTEFLLRNKAVLAYLGTITFCVLFLLFTNPFTDWIFTVTAARGYERGRYFYLLYPFVYAFFIFGVGYLIKYRKLIDKWKWIAFISLYIINLLGIILQYLKPWYKVEMFCTAMAFLFVLLIVYRPEENMDHSVLIPNFQAYKHHLNNILITKQNVRISVIKFINANNIRTYLGEHRYNIYMRKLFTHLIELLYQYRLNFELYYEAPGSIYLVLMNYKEETDLERSLSEMYRSIRKEFLEEEHTGAKFIPRVLVMDIPRDLKNFDDIIHLGHEFFGLTSYHKTITFAADIIGSKSFMIESNMDSILERAITENRLEMYYQPIYSVKKKRFDSAEALIRLKDKEYGFISPGIFIPAAEARGLILPIGDFVLDDVFKFISENDLKKYGIDHIEPNLSVAQCLEDELADKISDLEVKYNIDPKQINFEITETFFDNIGEIMDRNINRIRNMGYSFSLDDYGTGYSNIQRVSRLPFSIIKIDKSLVDIIDTTDGLAIIKNTINMMKDIDKKIVAEGVETKEQLDKLEELGCDYIQGFYFSKPLPKDEFLEFIKKNGKN